MTMNQDFRDQNPHAQRQMPRTSNTHDSMDLQTLLAITLCTSETSAPICVALSGGSLLFRQDGGSGRRRRAGGTGLYLAGKRAGLDGVIAAFGITPNREQLSLFKNESIAAVPA